MTEKDLYPSIDDLVRAKEITARTGNYCKSSGIYSLCDILSCYEQNDLKIKGAGSKTYIEINNLYETIMSLSPNHILFPIDKIMDPYEGHTIMKQLQSLQTDDFKRKAIEEKYILFIQDCPIRAQIWLEKIPLNMFISEYLCFYDAKSLKVRHFYVNSLPGTGDLKAKLKAEITRQFHLSEGESVGEEIRNHYGVSGSVDFPVSYYQKHHCYPMLWILEKHFENYDIDRDINVFKKTFKIHKNQNPLTLTEFANEYSLSRERVRQIRYHIFNYFFCSSQSVFKYPTDWEHYKPLSKDIIWEHDMQQYIDDEQTEFSSEFVLQIMLSLVYNKNYSFYGNGSYVLPIKTSYWKNVFIIKDDFADIFDFEKFRIEFKNRLRKNKSTYLLDAETYLIKSSCWKKRYRLSQKSDIANIIKDIIRYEFQLNPEPDGRFQIIVQKKRTLFDVMYEILTNNGNPMHISDIFAEFKKIMPEHYYSSPVQLRHYLLKHEAIACQNRKSVYVLREWTHVKSGTIRDSIVEFLTKKKLPQTAQSITDYVLQYFPETNIASIRTSIFNDTKERFVFFEGGFFGLSRKKYHPRYTLADNTLPSFEQRLIALEKFIVENGHFPFASSRNRDERILGVWWVRVTRGVYITDDYKQKEINRVKTQYAGCEESKRLFQWNANCEKVKHFLLENHRIPTVTTEKFMYHWLGRAKIEFLEHRMNEWQQQKYLELIELM
jgi:hypothetical protein